MIRMHIFICIARSWSYRHPARPCSKITVTFPSERFAQIACNSLSVDKEPRKSDVSRVLTVDGNDLNAYVSRPVMWVACGSRGNHSSRVTFSLRFALPRALRRAAVDHNRTSV